MGNDGTEEKKFWHMCSSWPSPSQITDALNNVGAHQDLWGLFRKDTLLADTIQ